MTEAGMVEFRWWTLPELEATDEEMWPHSLPRLVRDLIESGPPPEPIDAGAQATPRT